ncbi:hypothetical protein CKM354_000952100 [Cercospora kikuchii]|uniref:Cyclin N-terminal domain-containing protein n=1 Tax=Cercospora kikuchii TaxID=84275 RepID=A0A9P3FK26_9PEZI|nr:uncharacterized protein CKM354_000952100 [Cercospora kikuchii]GIZ46394.1 hypothetical protein CKM354_000952100 [Cercospora kikuchii]
MDAKPQRPVARAVRIHDENMPLPQVAGLAGKTLLHQRTKSASTINLKKQILGETNPNSKLAHKDDSEIGKTSPGKLKYVQEQTVAAPMQRPAVRPLGQKSSNMHVAAAIAATTKSSDASEPPTKKVAPKKSTKVLKDVAVPSKQPEVESRIPNAAAQVPYAVQHQELRTTETVPLRDDSANVSRHQSQPIVPVVAPQQSQLYLQTQESQSVPGGASAVYASSTPVLDQYDEYDDDDQDYMTARSFGISDPTQDLTTIFNPQHTKKALVEIVEAKEHVEATRTQEDIEDEQWDTSMVAEYGDEIFEYMREMETRMSPNPFYMELQAEIQWSMRAVLVDWVVQVHQRFNLLPETLFLTINYIDRFLSCKVVSLGKLQLVGATAIFVAAKYEEVNFPTMAELIYMVDNGYTADELLKAERFMLSMLQFELGWPGPMSFLRRISKADDYDLETRTLAKYFLEVTIMDERFVGCKPSFLAAGAHCMARLMLRKGEWSKSHVYYSNYTFRQLHRLLWALLECCQDAQKHHSAVFDKYTDKRYKRASTFVRGEIIKGFTLPFLKPNSFATLGAQDPSTGWHQQ